MPNRIDPYDFESRHDRDLEREPGPRARQRIQLVSTGTLKQRFAPVAPEPVWSPYVEVESK